MLCLLLPGTPLLAGTASASPAASACSGADLLPTRSNPAAIGSATLCLVDRIRAALHLPPVRANGNLRWVAASQVRDMVRRDYFADVRPSGLTPMSLIGASRYRAHAATVSVGQNIAWGTGTAATPASIVAAWMRSPSHRAVMLTGSFRDAGIYAVPAVPTRFGHGKYGATYAMEFGVRR